MVNNSVDQLAATLKAAGLCASLYDAKRMAESISDGTQKRHEEVEARITKYMGTGKRDDGFELIKERVGPSDHRPSPSSFVAQKMKEADEEVFVNNDSLGVDVAQDKVVAEIVEEPEEVLEVEEPKNPEPVQSSLSIFEESNEQPDIVVEESSQEQEVKAEVEPQQQEPGPNIRVEEGFVQERKVETPVQMVRPQPINPRRVDGFREVSTDKSKPRPQLTTEQKDSTDLTKWFYFGKK